MSNSADSVMIEGWTEWMQAASQSPGTIYVKRRYLLRLGTAHDLAVVTKREIVSWLASKSWGARTRRSVRSALRCFFRWARAEGLRDDDPAATLPTVKQPPASPRPTDERTFLKACMRSDRDVRLMLWLAGYAGLRRAEIAAVHSRDLVDDVLHVCGKGERTRIIPIEHAALLDELRARPEGWIFPGRFPGTHVGADLVGRRLSGALGPGWSGHSLRHRFASTAYRETQDLFAVQELLGHSKPETTREYVWVGEESLRRAARAAAA